jgi:hypothetical protein
MNPLVRRCLAVAVTALLVTPAAHAQNPQVRDGFWFSIGVGGGSLGCENCEDRTSGGAGYLAFGGKLSDNILLAGTLSGWGKSEDGVTLTVGLAALTARFYPSASGGFFLNAGVGVGSVDLEFDFGPGSFTTSETGAGALLGLGYDLRVGRMLSITPWLQWFGVSYDPGHTDVGQLGIALTVH